MSAHPLSAGGPLLTRRPASKIISSDNGYEKTLSAVAASLDKIGGGAPPARALRGLRACADGRHTGYIDLFLIHNPHAGTALRLETYRALLDLRAAGKLRDVGVSN